MLVVQIVQSFNVYIFAQMFFSASWVSLFHARFAFDLRLFLDVFKSLCLCCAGRDASMIPVSWLLATWYNRDLPVASSSSALHAIIYDFHLSRRSVDLRHPSTDVQSASASRLGMDDSRSSPETPEVQDMTEDTVQDCQDATFGLQWTGDMRSWFLYYCSGLLCSF